MNYHDIVEHYEKCYCKNGDNNRGVDWPNEADAETRYSVMNDIIRFDKSETNKLLSDEITILDFGCGLGHMLQYLIEHDKLGNHNYCGLDISSLFINRCREKFPSYEFYLCDILNEKLEVEADYVIMNGVFTEKLQATFDDMFGYFKDVVQKVFDISKRGIAFNVMSSHVDWTRDDLFHVPLDVLADFVIDKLSRNFVIRNDYGLYEYTVYVYKSA